MWILCIISFMLSSASSQDEPTSVHLKAVHRLNDTSIIDNYFSCNGTGPSLHWQVNSLVFGFTGNHSVGAKAQRSPSEGRSVAFLLDIAHVVSNTFSYTSVLIVTSRNQGTFSSLSVRCIIGSSITPVNISDISSTAVDKPSGNLYLEYLFSADITSETTYVYACGVNHTLQGWQASGTSPFIFRDSNIIGDDRQMPSSGTVPEVFVILIATEPYSLSSVFFATGIERLNVTCTSNSAVETIYFSELPKEAPTEIGEIINIINYLCMSRV